MSTYTVEYNYCDCHPETCCCDSYVLKEDGKFYLSSNDKDKLVDLANRLNGVCTNTDKSKKNKKGAKHD